MTGSPRANGEGVNPPRGDGSAGQAARGIPPGPGAPSGDDSPGVPGFPTWGRVYWFVFGVFAAVVVGLTVFTEVFG
jgi:hypothetical protein